MNMKNIVNELPYKIKKNNDPKEIKNYLNKQNRNNKILAMFSFILGALNLILLIVYLTEKFYTISFMHTIMLIIQTILFPLLGYQLLRRIKLNLLSEEEIKEHLK